MTTPAPLVAEAQRLVDQLVDRVAELTKAANRNATHNNADSASERKYAETRTELATARRELDEAQHALAQRQMEAEQTRFGDRIAVAEEDVRIMQHALASAALRVEEDPGNADLQKTLAQCRADLVASEQRLENLNLARTAAANRDLQQESKERHSRLADLHVQHKAAEKKALKLSADLVDYLAAAGPKWIAAHQAVRDVISLHQAALRLAGGPKALQSHAFAANATESLLAHGIICALAATRISQTGPSLAPYVTIDTPGGPQMGASQMTQKLTAQFERQRETVERYAPELNEPTFFKGTPVSKDFYDLSGGN
jgi:uncharacterized protein (DUF4415 family)